MESKLFENKQNHVHNVSRLLNPVRTEDQELLVDDGDHPLLEERTPSYSATVVQRAYTMWMNLGMKNDFKTMCDYYHRLEAVKEPVWTEQGGLYTNIQSDQVRYYDIPVPILYHTMNCTFAVSPQNYYVSHLLERQQYR